MFGAGVSILCAKGGGTLSMAPVVYLDLVCKIAPAPLVAMSSLLDPEPSPAHNVGV
jgi:hypothetical protein